MQSHELGFFLSDVQNKWDDNIHTGTLFYKHSTEKYSKYLFNNLYLVFISSCYNHFILVPIVGVGKGGAY